MIHRVALAAAALLLVNAPAPAQQPAPAVLAPMSQSPTLGLTVGQPMVLGRISSGGRTIIAPDAVASPIVAGAWQAPKAGDSVTLSDGKALRWQAAAFGAQSTLSSEAFAAGYADVPVESASDQVVILDASGHSMVYVNGEPRMGDPYGSAWTRLPIALHQGRNELLFRGGRGNDLRLQFRMALGQVSIDAVETTLPDLVENQPGRALGAVIVVNATTEWQRGWFLRASMKGGQRSAIPIDPLAPLSIRKIGFEFDVPAGVTGTTARLNTSVARSADENEPAPSSAVLSLRIRKPAESRKVTFRSAIDGSVQYYAVRPAVGADGAAIAAEGLPLILTLHGAGVEALGQVDAYQSKPWASIVAPTNRRPFGFDWEDWGRLDALEVLDQARATLKPDPQRLYLTGHSMGGHGTWQIGAHFAPMFAAIAPSAGWISFRSYAGGAAYDGGTSVESILARAASPSDTLALKDNYGSTGVYILHGEADDNVPVGQAREMRKMLGEFHPDFAYYERPGAGHWWGNQCVDWPPLMRFLEDHVSPIPREVRHARFTTSAPVVASSFAFGAIWEQIEQLKPSRIDLSFDPAKRLFKGTTTNIALLALRLADLSASKAEKIDPSAPAAPALGPGRPISVELDGHTLTDLPWPAGGVLFLERAADEWRAAEPSPRWFADHKGPGRAGMFKNAFTNNVQLVVGTGGTAEENAWCLAQARFDSEAFWYRGNGSLPILLDTEFDPSKNPDRNVVLYGNGSTNRAWKPLLGDSPVQVAEGEIAAGERKLAASDLACLLIRPRPGSQTASVGAIAGTGIAGMRLTTRVPYFQSGVGIPDWIIVGPEAVESGLRGIRGAGFFGNDWTLSPGDSAWADAPNGAPGASGH